MPLYEFRCHDCGYSEDVRQTDYDEHNHKCPKCGKSMVRAFNRFAFCFSDRMRSLESLE